MTPRPEENDPVSHLWNVADATHNWLDKLASLTLEHLNNPTPDSEMELRLACVAALDATRNWRSHWS